MLTTILIALAAFLVLGFNGRGYAAWVLAGAVLFIGWLKGGVSSEPLFFALFVPYALAALVFGLAPLRRVLVSGTILPMAAKTLPTISETEKIALEAGTVWWEGDLFNGNPDWQKLLDLNITQLSPEERAFLDNETEQLCAMIDDYKIAQDRDLSPKVWKFMKDKRFFGMEIPKEFGGLDFSAAAHAAVVTKIATRSVTAAVTVMVPNSLGPGELLQHYGTKEQKDHYLPRLANGRDIPCFALTEPHAGSDAANGRSTGTVCYGTWKGKKTLGMKLTFNKRYITLAPVATVVGLAFRLYDPENLLGKGQEDIGITCALLPRDTKGLIIGNRHDPSNTPFMNGTVQGKDVFVPLDYIIGGPDFAGQGWRMLMECLSTGRGISLPSLSVGAGQFALRAASAYAGIREQFNTPIAQFEGIRAVLYRLLTRAYRMEATRVLTVAGVDAGEKPAVSSAIAKAYLTEDMRQSLNDAMDIQAGAAIIRGPKNILNQPYASIPIGITVEGANILTRSLIVFGQGAIRCHPFIQQEVAALQGKDVKGFDKALMGHLNHVTRNGVRSAVLALTGPLFVDAPRTPLKAQMIRLSRYSAAFAYLADMGLMTLGGSLKRCEHLSGYYADAFAHLYMASATLKRAHDAGYPAEHLPAVNALLTEAFFEIEQALDSVLRNLPNRLVAAKARVVTFPLGMHAKRPTDAQKEAAVNSLYDAASTLRDQLTHSVFIPKAGEEGMGGLEEAYALTVATDGIRKQVKKAKKKGEDVILTKEDEKLLAKADKARDAAVQVDSFAPEVFKTLR